MTIAVITGTRPEIIKMYPIMRLFDSRSIDYKYIHTGQHYEYNLFIKFIEEFGIRKPDICISADISSPIKQVSTIMNKIGNVISQIRPSLVLVEGDTNSVLASALAALKSGTAIAHVESGLRSNDWKTVEEHNRRIVDHISDILFSPTDISTQNLTGEHVHGEIHTVGNTIIDAINLSLSHEKSGPQLQSEISDSTTLEREKVQFNNHKNDDEYVLVTLHRSENVDEMAILKLVFDALSESSHKYIFPMHPRTMKRVQQFGLMQSIGNNIKITEPVGYSDFLRLLKGCKFVITDSGGVQEEITSPQINKKAIVLRECTERPESVDSGHSVLCSIEHDDILELITEFHRDYKAISLGAPPYGNGDSAFKITELVEKKYL
jgi:UDP-N-acetylglucosamine 2-epimerase (non-hydrolysing)